MIPNLEQYLKDSPVVDHALRARIAEDGSVSLYIHPKNANGATMDFKVVGNELVPFVNGQAANQQYQVVTSNPGAESMCHLGFETISEEDAKVEVLVRTTVRQVGATAIVKIIGDALATAGYKNVMLNSADLEAYEKNGRPYELFSENKMPELNITVTDTWPIQRHQSRMASRQMVALTQSIGLRTAKPEDAYFRPLWTENNKDVFVDPATIPPHVININGSDYASAPLKFGMVVDVLSLTNVPVLAEAGFLDMTDVVKDVVIDAVLLEMGGEKPRILQLWVPNYRLVSSKPSQESDVFAGCVDVSLDHPDVLSTMVTIDLQLNGSLCRETGSLELNAGRVLVRKINGEEFSRETLSEPMQQLIEGIESGSWIGFNAKIYRSNPNRR